MMHQPFEIPIPVLPDFNFDIPNIEVPMPDINLPPLICGTPILSDDEMKELQELSEPRLDYDHD